MDRNLWVFSGFFFCIHARKAVLDPSLLYTEATHLGSENQLSAITEGAGKHEFGEMLWHPKESDYLIPYVLLVLMPWLHPSPLHPKFL